MPTPTAQITGSYTSGLHYVDYGCTDLAIELGALARRENQLGIAQEQRIKTSQSQTFWWGIGQGDGIDASELGHVNTNVNTHKRVPRITGVRSKGNKSLLLFNASLSLPVFSG